MAGLTLEGVRKNFGDVSVIHGVDLAIDDGEFTVFVGPSGCGKSTLLRLVSGLEETSAGRITIGGQDVTQAAPSDRGIAMVFQSYALYPHMSVWQNMAFGLRMAKTPADEIDRRVRKAAAILHLEPYLQRTPRQLSGGQRQRVAIGRAIVRDPKVFLFDEPLSNLDAELRVQMRLEIAKLHRDLGATMIYVTHDQTEAMTLADKIVVLQAGRVEQVGAPLRLYDDPDNLFVAGFIGSPKMNFIDGVTGADGKVTLWEGVQLAPRYRDRPPPPGLAVKLGIRPEHFDRPDLIGDVTWPLRVDIVEHLGSTSQVHGKLPNGASLVVERRGTEGITAGGMLNVSFRTDDLRVFGPDGNRIR